MNCSGSLSKPSKMPGFGYGLPALVSCHVGSKLAKIPNSVCSKCYALKGCYQFPVVKAAQALRYLYVEDPRWVESMVELIRRKRTKYFRWHDSGDIISLLHLMQICEVAERLPDFIFWLPTRERKIVNTYRRLHGEFPKNLTVRISAAMIDGAPPVTDLCTSTVHRDKDPIGFACPASTQGNKCGLCRACWDKTVKNISYIEH